MLSRVDGHSPHTLSLLWQDNSWSNQIIEEIRLASETPLGLDDEHPEVSCWSPASADKLDEPMAELRFRTVIDGAPQPDLLSTDWELSGYWPSSSTCSFRTKSAVMNNDVLPVSTNDQIRHQLTFIGGHLFEPSPEMLSVDLSIADFGRVSGVRQLEMLDEIDVAWLTEPMSLVVPTSGLIGPRTQLVLEGPATLDRSAVKNLDVSLCGLPVKRLRHSTAGRHGRWKWIGAVQTTSLRTTSHVSIQVSSNTRKPVGPGDDREASVLLSRIAIVNK